jgi:hypothetical protein
MTKPMFGVVLAITTAILGIMLAQAQQQPRETEALAYCTQAVQLRETALTARPKIEDVKAYAAKVRQKCRPGDTIQLNPIGTEIAFLCDFSKAIVTVTPFDLDLNTRGMDQRLLTETVCILADERSVR